ncbi:MAG: NUDIX domain-containing protein [Clostridiales bacterium]|nr:NUDIX domain-containing protein [Clostridiales bacterium]
MEKKMGSYFQEKSKMYYEKYKAGEFVKKVGAIIKDGDKYLTIIRDGKRAMFAGGSVDEGESTRQAVVREVFEETGAKVIALKYLKKEYYTVDWEFNGVTFPNRRVSYTYLCEIEKGDLSAKGLEGEFAENTTLKWCTLEELEQLKLWEPTLDLIKKIESENQIAKV